MPTSQEKRIYFHGTGTAETESTSTTVSSDSSTFTRPLLICDGNSIARKIHGCSDVRSDKFTLRAAISSWQHSTFHAFFIALYYLNSSFLLRRSHCLPHKREESIHVRVVVALCNEVVRICCLHDWFQLLAPSFEGYLVFWMEVKVVFQLGWKKPEIFVASRSFISINAIMYICQ